MASAIKLSDELVNDAKAYAKVMQRSATGQIEYWARIGRLMEENPDLPYAFVRDTLIGLEEAGSGKVSDYEFG
ncbi:MAG: ParD-like family protein [Gammaproteobacteria bacterium]